MGTVSGEVFVGDRPQPLAVISFFLEKNGLPPVANGLQRVPEFLARTDHDANFKVNLVSGHYYIGILARAPEAPPGPPRAGEVFHFAADESGRLLVLHVAGMEHLDAGRINGLPPDRFFDESSFFTLEGLVRNEAGEPVPDIAVLAKNRLNTPRPKFISERTGEDGRFRLKLPAGHSFYLVARHDIATARPLPGSYVGTYGIHSKTGLATLSMFSAGSPSPGVLAHDEESRALTVAGASGETIRDIEIFMYPVPDPEIIKQSVKSSVAVRTTPEAVLIKSIFFAANSSNLDEYSHRELDMCLSFLAGHETVEIEIVGHTDNLGAAAANLQLSENRAMSVAAYLLRAGLPPDRVRVSGVGGAEPAADNETPEGRRKNRRVEIRVNNPID
jgi:outer membrane protein OmpA-like peptidoglycan-associated protein